jgi:hypothetical protein
MCTCTSFLPGHFASVLVSPIPEHPPHRTAQVSFRYLGPLPQSGFLRILQILLEYKGGSYIRKNKVLQAHNHSLGDSFASL